MSHWIHPLLLSEDIPLMVFKLQKWFFSAALWGKVVLLSLARPHGLTLACSGTAGAGAGGGGRIFYDNNSDILSPAASEVSLLTHNSFILTNTY